MNINKMVSINSRLKMVEQVLLKQGQALAGFDLYLRSVEKMLLSKNLCTKEELDAIRKSVIEEFLSKKSSSLVTIPE